MYAIERLRQECTLLVKEAMGEGFGQFSEKVKLETPPKGIEADLALPCFAISKNPAEFASELAVKISPLIKKGSLVHKAEPRGPYVNFTADSKFYGKLVLDEITKMEQKYGSGKKKNKLIIIDFSSPNIAKPMHLGHLRSTIIGQSLYNIHSFLGYRCIGDNHLGDWGTQFGKLIAAYKTWGDAHMLKKGGVKYLTELYVRFHEEMKTDPYLEEQGRKWFSRLEKGEKDATALWKTFYAISMEEFRRTYSMLNVKFDTEMGESIYYKDGLKIVKEALSKKVAEKSEGAIIIKFESMVPLVIQKSDESTLYSTRDLACIRRRLKKRPDRILYVISSGQKLYLKQLFEAAKKLGMRGNLVHVDFGTVTMEGAKMSTREGKYVLLNDIAAESVKRAGAIIREKNPGITNWEEVAQQVGIGSVIFNDLKQDRIKDIDFDWSKALNFEGDSCPYLQYAYVRTRSIMEKAGNPRKCFHEFSKEEIRLIKKLSAFPSVVESSGAQNKPNIIAQYLLELAGLFSEFYISMKVIGSPEEYQRLEIVKATGIVLKTGMTLLNIETPEKM